MSGNFMEENTQQELSAALYIASACGLYDVAEFCIDREDRINSKMILIAYENVKDKTSSESINRKEKLLKLLKTKAKEMKSFPDKDGCYPIHLAALEDDLEFVRENIEENAEDANIHLTYLSKNILPENKSDYVFNLKNASLYHIAVFEGNRELMDLLQKNNVPTSLVDSDGRSPFLYAIEIGKSKVIKPLFEITKRDGNEMRPNTKGDTPLHLAIIKSVKSVSQREKESKILFRNIALDICRNTKGDLHHKNRMGQSPLHTACIYKQTEVISELLKSEENFHVKEQNLLHELIKEKNNHYDAIGELLSCGFDCNMKNGEDKTPLDIAKELRDEKIISMLQNVSQSKTQTQKPPPS